MGDRIIDKKKGPFGGRTFELFSLLGRARPAAAVAAGAASVPQSVVQKPASADAPLSVELLERQIAGLRQLLEIGKRFSSTLDYPRLIDTVLSACIDQMKVPKAALFTRRDLEIPDFTLQRNMKGFEPDHTVEYVVSEGHEIIRRFASEFRCYTMDEIVSSVSDRFSLEPLRRLAPSIIVPLRARGIINGIILLGRRGREKSFSDEEKAYLLEIAALAGIAIHNAFLFEMTSTDMMTKLKLRHYFHSALVERQEEAAATGGPLSLIMMDIDQFKRLNDTYGQTCGDAVLRDIAAAILKSIRSVDLASRYGGEEFVVLLPETDLATARIIAERIRVAIESRIFEYEDYQIKVTMSLGVAQYDPVRDTLPRRLIERADNALFASKKGGRNRVSVG